MKNRIILCVAALIFGLLAVSISNADVKSEPLKLTELMAGIADYEKKEVTLIGTIAGACNSGCKVWVSDGVYKKGDPVALVWAKDKAFTFKTNATGKKIMLKGYAVGKYIDLCSVEQKKEAKEKEGESGCNPIIETETGQKQLSAITFFATSAEYL